MRTETSTAMRRDDADADAEPAALTEPDPAVTGSLRVLFVDDQEACREIGEWILRHHGFTVTTACNGREALDTFARQTFDCVIMDIQMPVMDGLQATTEIRQYEAALGGTGRPTPHVAIIAVTSCETEGMREQCLAAGMDDYLSKPLKGRDLLAAITRWCPHAAASIQAENPVDAAEPPLHEQWSPELRHRLTSLYLANLAGYLDGLRSAITAGDAAALARAAHAFKGATALFPAAEVEDAARRLESMGRAGDLSDGPSLLAALECEVERLRPALARLL